ncbi:MAG TPA: helix-turn-helix domain-containing protein [Thermoplasmata archaeon]|nr:helix-turn-helix domain-containing protein [Thermoplasmata archaeon]
MTRALDLDRACVIREQGEEYCIYPLDDLMAVLGKKWALFIMAVLGNDSRTRFNDLLRQLKGVSPRTLTDRLKELANLRLIERTVYPEVPLRVEYALTEDGKRMRRALIPFLKWSIDFETGRTST